MHAINYVHLRNFFAVFYFRSVQTKLFWVGGGHKFSCHKRHFRVRLEGVNKKN